MKKPFKKFLAGILAVSVISASSFVFAEQTEEVELFSEGTTVVKTYTGSENVTLVDQGKFGATFETNYTGVPFKAEDDAVFAYGGTAATTGWNLKQDTHGSNAFTYDAASIKSVNTAKLIFELDVLVMKEGNGISMRYTPNGGSMTTVGGQLLGGDKLTLGQWCKIIYVLGNTESDKTYEIYVNNKLINSGTLSGYGSTGAAHKLYPHAADGSPIEFYVDNMKVIAADSYEAYTESSVISIDENITVEDNTISGITYGTTIGQLKEKLSVENGTDIFMGNSESANISSDEIISDGYKIASVSEEGLYTYYTTKVKYIPGDIHSKIIVKKNSVSDVTVSNFSGITDSAILIYVLEDNTVNGKVYTYYLNDRTDDIACTLDTPAENIDDIKVVLVNNVSNLSSSVPTDNTVKINLAVESGVTVSGTSNTPVILMILNPETEFDASSFTEESYMENIYYTSVVDTDENLNFSFDTVGFKASGIYTYLIYKDDTLYVQKMFAPGTQAVINFKAGLESLSTPGDLKTLLDADAVTGDTGLVYDYYNQLNDDEQLKLSEEIIASLNLYNHTTVSLDEFADELKYRSMIPAMVKDNSDESTPTEKVFELLDVENKVFNLSGTAVDTYAAMSEADRKTVCGYICANPELVTNPESLQSILNISVINTKLDAAITHSDAYDTLKTYSDALEGLDFDAYAKLTTEQETVNMGVINKKPFSTPSELVETVNDLIDEAVKKEKEKTNDDGKTSGGGRSSKSGGSVTSSTPIQTPVTVVEEENAFSDLDNVEWAQEAINILNKKGIVSGRGDRIFDPNGNVTREEFVKMIVEAAGLKTYITANDFSDVKSSDWFDKYISIAKENGITNGMGDGKFGVGENITRQDMMVMCMYLIPESAKAGSIKNYSDASEVADYAVDAVSTLVNIGIVNGDGGRLMPNSDCTRAQAAKVIYMILKYNNQN